MGGSPGLMMLNQPDNTPLVLRRTDLIKAVVPAVKDAVGPTGSDGDDFGELMAFIERFTGHFGRIVEMVNNLKGESQAANIAPASEPRAQNVAPTIPRLTAIQIYQLALGKLAQAPQDMTIGAAFEIAKTGKAFVLAEIQKELNGLYDNARQ